MELVWSQVNKNYICNRARAIQLRIVHRLHITPLIKISLTQVIPHYALSVRLRWEITPTVYGTVA